MSQDPVAPFLYHASYWLLICFYCFVFSGWIEALSSKWSCLNWSTHTHAHAHAKKKIPHLLIQMSLRNFEELCHTEVSVSLPFQFSEKWNEWHMKNKLTKLSKNISCCGQSFAVISHGHLVKSKRNSYTIPMSSAPSVPGPDHTAVLGSVLLQVDMTRYCKDLML